MLQLMMWDDRHHKFKAVLDLILDKCDALQQKVP